MDIKEQFARRVSEGQVAKVLTCLATLPGKRGAAISGDISGNFDFWFNGGAGKVHTGYIEYELADGTRATVGEPVPALSVTILFANGCQVNVQQISWGLTG